MGEGCRLFLFFRQPGSRSNDRRQPGGRNLAAMSVPRYVVLGGTMRQFIRCCALMAPLVAIGGSSLGCCGKQGYVIHSDWTLAVHRQPCTPGCTAGGCNCENQASIASTRRADKGAVAEAGPLVQGPGHFHPVPTRPVFGPRPNEMAVPASGPGELSPRHHARFRGSAGAGRARQCASVRPVARRRRLPAVFRCLARQSPAIASTKTQSLAERAQQPVEIFNRLRHRRDAMPK